MMATTSRRSSSSSSPSYYDNNKKCLFKSFNLDDVKSFSNNSIIVHDDDDDKDEKQQQQQQEQQLHQQKHHEEVVNYISDVSNHMSSFSRIINPHRERSTPVFDRNELIIGDLLGSGGFCDVYELKRFANNQNRSSVRSINTPRDSNHNICHNVRERAAIKNKALSGKHQYAVKFLRKEVADDSTSDTFQDAATDLYLEGKYLIGLSAFPHPNIIQIHGISSSGLNGFIISPQEKQDSQSSRVSGTCNRNEYFLILDRLSDTLDNRLDVWAELKKILLQRNENEVTTSRRSINEQPLKKEQRQHDCANQQMLDTLFIQQLRVSRDISSALSHLHSLKIIFRDLKPNNVGFDANGTVKLFDFGLAREIDPSRRVVTNDTNSIDGNSNDEKNYYYEMTGKVGTVRYCAPEVLRNQPYNTSAEVYSLALVIWQILSLEKPYQDIEEGCNSRDEFIEEIVYNHTRPKIIHHYDGDAISIKWPKSVCKVIKKSWSNNPSKRPSMKDVNKILERQVRTLEDAAGIIKPSRNGRSSSIQQHCST